MFDIQDIWINLRKCDLMVLSPFQITENMKSTFSKTQPGGRGE